MRAMCRSRTTFIVSAALIAWWRAACNLSAQRPMGNDVLPTATVQRYAKNTFPSVDSGGFFFLDHEVGQWFVFSSL